MSIHNPETIDELVDYTKRKLGEDRAEEGTLEVDITDNQAYDCIEDAIQLWKTYAYDGCVECFYIIPTVTGKTEYKLPPNTFAVYGYLTQTEYTDMFSLDYQMRTHIGLHYKTYDLTTIEITKEHLALMDLKLGKKYMYSFNAVTKTLTITAGAKTGCNIIVTASKYIDSVPNIYNEPWIKEYVEALFLKQWGTNFRQFEGVKLPGGVSINWKEMVGDANTRIKELREELINYWSRPVRFKRG